MNTGADEGVIEDLTSLVARDVGADEPDMSTNDLSYVDVQDLFYSYQDSGRGGQEEAVVEAVAFVSPLDALKEAVLALDWEVSSRNLNRCLAEIDPLLERYLDDQYCVALLKMLSTIVRYLDAEKANAHPDSVKVLTSAYVCLDKIVSALDMAAAEKNKAVADEVVKFKTLRQKIAANVTGRRADRGEVQGPRDVDALLALKAMVLSVDWGEITQERIDAFLAEIAALKKRWQGDGTLVQGLEILRAYGQYIFVKKKKAHPDSFSQLFASYNSLERVLVSDHLTPGEKKDIISLELQKFIALKQRIAAVQEQPRETTPAPGAVRADAAKEEGEARRQAESGEAASFLTAVDTRLDDFFAEKDAVQAAALQVAEIPGDERPTADDRGAPAAMVEDFVAAMVDEDEGPAMFMEELPAPPEEFIAPVIQQEAIVEEVTVEEAVVPEEEAPVLVVAEEVLLPAEDSGGSLLPEELLLQVEESAPGPMAEAMMPLPSGLEGAEAEDHLAEALPLAEEVSRDQTIPVADEMGLAELGEIVTEPVASVMDEQALASDRAASVAHAAEELFAPGMVGEQAEVAAPASSSRLWLGELAPVIAELPGECSDMAVAALRQQIDTVAAQQAISPVDGIALDLLSAVSAQLAVMAAGDRATGVALLQSLCEQLAPDATGKGAGTEASALAVIQSLVHGTVVWQRDAVRLTTGRFAVDQASAPVAAPALTEEGQEEGPAATPETPAPQGPIAPAGSFFEKIRQLFRKK